MADSKSILLVDDDEAHLLWSTEILKDGGYDIESTSSVERAIKMLSDRAYDLVISDLMMPEMSGVEFVRRVAGIRKGQKAIILTGHGDIDSFIESVYDLGALEYIIKPVEAEEFLMVVKKLLSQSSPAVNGK
ncbi:MAG: response regulator [Nitrospinae bacterium]|nr:response regulator [Nitrospinota bacterium]